MALAVAAPLVAGCAPPQEQADRDGPVARRLPGTAASASPSPSPTADEAFPAYAATVVGDSIDVFDGPDGAATTTLTSPLPSGAPLTFLVVERRADWLHVLLPVKPNGSSGWVRRAAVEVAGVPYRLDVRTAAHELDLYEHGRLVRTYPIGIGKQDTPTPGGTFYLKELLRAPDPGGAYGPYAYGLSGFSTTLDSFAGGDAVIGLHGTNEPSSIGRDVSAGCIRLRNEHISELADKLPLGTPVRILA